MFSKKTLRALEIHLVNLIAQNEAYINHPDLAPENNFVSENNPVAENEALRSCLKAYISQLFGKEEIHSMDNETIIGTDYARLSLKTQSLLRSVVANLPTDIQLHILRSKAMFRFVDLWFKYFKKLVTATILDLDELDECDNVFIQLDWEEHFGSTLRVYEKKHPFPGLLINYDDGSIVANDLDDDDDRDPHWLSQMF